MIKDEFNQIEVTNDKQLLRSEFGKTQKVEFSPQNENKLPEGDLNEKYIGKTIRKETEVNVDYINKVPTHATQTVVTTSSSAAATAGAVTASAAVSVSTIAAVVVATVTGVSIALHDYHYEFESFIVMSDRLEYELTVFDKNDDKTYLEYEEYENDPDSDKDKDPMEVAPFLLRVSNSREYNVAQPIFYHQNNEGIFEDLTLGETYNITLTENRVGGETICNESFTTYLNVAFNSFNFSGACDMEEGYFEVEMNFVDELDQYSDFELYLYDLEIPEEINYVFALEKLSGVQRINNLDEDNYWIVDLNKEWGYKFSYLDNQEKVEFANGTVAFTDKLGRASKFNKFIFDKTANFIDNTITVQLDYQDDFNWLNEFKLTLTQIPQDDQSGTGNPDDYYSAEINLRKTTEPQTIELNEYEIMTRLKNFKYTYSLICRYRDDYIFLDEETTPFSFTDTSGGVSEFYSFEFDKKADFVNNTFDVRLNYKDDFHSFSSFVLHLYPEGVNAQYDFSLDPTAVTQTCTFDESLHWNYSLDYTYTYTLTYWDDYGEVTIGENSGSFKFTDVQNRVAEVRGVTFDGTYDMGTGMAPVQIDYQDDFGYLDDFTMLFYGPIDNQGGTDPLIHYANSDTLPPIEDYEYSVSLVKTTEVQYINLYESGIPISEEGQFLYAFTYTRKGVEQTPIQVADKFYFDDPDALSEVRGITFVNGEADFIRRCFDVQLDFDDDYGYFSNFELQVWDDKNGGWVEKPLRATTEVQTVYIDEYDYDEYKYPVDIVTGTLTYNLVYTSAETGDPATQYFFEQSQPLSFENSLKSEFYDLETSFDFTSTDVGEEYRLPFRFNMVNDAEYYSVPEIYIAPLSDQTDVLGSIAFANEVVDTGWQYGSFVGNDNFTIQDLTNGDQYYLVVTMQYTDEHNDEDYRSYVYTEAHSFTLDQKQGIYGVDVSNYLTAGDWTVYTTVFANGDLSGFSNGEIIFQRADGNYAALAYDVQISEYMTIDLHSPKEYTVNEDDLQEYFSHPVNITFKYSKPGSNEIITLNCYSNYLFSISN